MARKKKGYVELEWTCPVCDTRNPGTRRTCAGCGSPQPEDVEFETPAQAKLIEDEAVLAQAQAGPDIHCGYCGTRNPANAATCKQCGGDLTEGTARAAGEVVGALNTEKAPDVECATCGTMNLATARTCVNCGSPLQKAKPKPPAQPKPAKSSGIPKFAIGCLALIVLGVVAFFFFANRTDQSTGVAQEARWTRTIAIEGLAPVQREAWWDEIPVDATPGACRQEVRRTVDEPVANAREVCGTEYVVDSGDGLGEVLQDCVYQVLEDRCQYSVLQWQVVERMVERGVGAALAWPALTLTNNQREGDRSQNLECVFAANDEEYTFTLRNEAQLAQCTPGSRWELEINTFGNVLSAQPAN